MPTASPCADGQMSGPSAQRPSSTGDGADRRRTVTVGTQLSTPTVTVGANRTVGTETWRPKVTVGTATAVGRRADRRAQPLGCHGAVYSVPTVAHGATAAVGTGTENWVPPSAVPTVTHGTKKAVGTANCAHFFVFPFFWHQRDNY